MQQMIFIADLIACSAFFGHHYAHHQELESITQVVAACGIWCFGLQPPNQTHNTPYRQLENQTAGHLYIMSNVFSSFCYKSSCK
jgi:hypothetical protein